MSGTDTRHIDFDTLVALIEPAFRNNGCSDTVTRLLARNCVSAERDGAHSHGLFRLAGYVSSLKANWVDGRAVPSVADVAPGFIRVDANNGFTVPALDASREAAIGKARRTGTCTLAIRNSHHLGALSLDVEPFADAGLVAIAFINSMKSVVPYGGHSAVYGTNPIAFAAPTASGAAFVFDQASSMMANGDVQIAAREGRALPEGVGVDRHGAATTDPRAVLDGGALKAFGGHKDSSIALMVEILCAALVGGPFSAEMDLAAHPGAATPHTGQSFILIDPTAGSAGLPNFADRVTALLDMVKAAGQERLPGERRLVNRIEAREHGIPVEAAMLEKIAALAG